MSLNMPLPITDSYSYQNYQRQRQLTLGDLLLENRIVFLQGEIYTGNANEVVMKLLYLQSENRRKDIHFYVNSPGGDVAATLAIYDTMQMLSCPICTYCVGQAASGAAGGRIVVVTDLQQAGWEASDEGAVPDGITVDVVEVAPTAVGSADITALVAERIVRETLTGVALRRRDSAR